MTDEETMEAEQNAFEALCAAIRLAWKNGMTAEFVHSFGNERANGESTLDAVRHACREWDL